MKHVLYLAALLVGATGHAAAAAGRRCQPPAEVLSRAAAPGCCLNQVPAIKPGSAPAFASGVMAHFAYPGSFGLPDECADACADFQPLFAQLARDSGADNVSFVNGAQNHLSEPSWLALRSGMHVCARWAASRGRQAGRQAAGWRI